MLCMGSQLVFCKFQVVFNYFWYLFFKPYIFNVLISSFVDNMPLTYKRKSGVYRGEWTERGLIDTFEAVSNGMGINEAAKTFGIPKTTFKRRLAKKTQLKPMFSVRVVYCCLKMRRRLSYTLKNYRKVGLRHLEKLYVKWRII